MLKIGCLVLGFFELILWVPPKLIPDTVNNDLRAFKMLLEEGFEVGLRDESGAFIVALMLSLLAADEI